MTAPVPSSHSQVPGLSNARPSMLVDVTPYQQEQAQCGIDTDPGTRGRGGCRWWGG